MKKMLVIIAALIASPAFALFAPLPDSAINPSRWQVTHIGETLVDGVRTAALIEESVAELSIPGQRVGDTMLPRAIEKTQKEYRLTLASIDQPQLRARVELSRQTAFVNGQLTKIFHSKGNAQGLRFVIRSVGDCRLEASFSRDGEASIQQRFEMIPSVQVM